VRRINAVKQYMLDGYTIEESQGQFLLYTDLIEGIAEHLAELWNRLDKDRDQLEGQALRELQKEMAECRKAGDELVERLGELTRRIAAPRTDTLRLAGAAGGAEDLL
jgi:Mg2+ and Co2+ transporter CorA